MFVIAEPSVARRPQSGILGQGAGRGPGGAKGRRVQQVNAQSAFRFNE